MKSRFFALPFALGVLSAIPSLASDSIFKLELSGTIQPVHIDTHFSYTPATSGGIPPYSYRIASGTLPPGLTFDSSHGSISGTPTQLGKYPIKIEVTDQQPKSVEHSFEVHVVTRVAATIRPIPQRMARGERLNSTIETSGGVPPYFYELVNEKNKDLDPYLTLVGDKLQGSFSFLGPQTVTIKVSDHFNNSTSVSVSSEIYEPIFLSPSLTMTYPDPNGSNLQKLFVSSIQPKITVHLSDFGFFGEKMLAYASKSVKTPGMVMVTLDPKVEPKATMTTTLLAEKSPL